MSGSHTSVVALRPEPFELTLPLSVVAKLPDSCTGSSSRKALCRSKKSFTSGSCTWMLPQESSAFLVVEPSKVISLT